jgi:hypothetical protein
MFKGHSRISSSLRTNTPHSLETSEIPNQWRSVISQSMIFINYASVKPSVFTGFGNNREWRAGYLIHSGPILRVTNGCNVIQKGFILFYMAPNRVLLRSPIRNCVAVGELGTPQSFLFKNCLSWTSLYWRGLCMRANTFMVLYCSLSAARLERVSKR